MLIEHPISGKRRKAGDVLFVDRKAAAVLIQTGIAIGEEQSYETAVMTAEPVRPILKLKRSYKRRDMKAKA